MLSRDAYLAVEACPSSFLDQYLDFSGLAESSSPFPSLGMADPKSGDVTFVNEESNTDPAPSLSDEYQYLATVQYTFPDENMLEIPVLQTLRAGLNVASMLGVHQDIWDPSFRSVLSRDLLQNTAIPVDFQPTAIQCSVAHHPIFDILPWATVRTKLIYIFSLPPQNRPPSAQDPLAILNIVYDMDDLTEGFRVKGRRGLEAEDWEIGLCFFRNWWWALDRAIVKHSNKLRCERGARALTLG